MIKSRFLIFALAGAAWTTAVALLGITSEPAGNWPYIFGHPWRYWMLGYLWVVAPLAFVLVAVCPPGSRLERFLLSFRKRPPQPDRQAWGERILVIFGLYLIGLQTLETAGVALYWRVPAYAAAVRGGPHLFGLPDPGHWVLRFQLASAGLLLAWFGNGLPKLLSPFRGRREPYDWGQMMRLCGLAIALGGITGALCAALIPDFRIAYIAAPACVMAGCAACLPIWLVYRIGGRPTGLAPPEG